MPRNKFNLTFAKTLETSCSAVWFWICHFPARYFFFLFWIFPPFSFSSSSSSSSFDFVLPINCSTRRSFNHKRNSIHGQDEKGIGWIHRLKKKVEENWLNILFLFSRKRRTTLQEPSIVSLLLLWMERLLDFLYRPKNLIIGVFTATTAQSLIPSYSYACMVL